MIGVFVGRFQPFHKGHFLAIKWILKKTKKLAVFIGSLQEFNTFKNPFTFEERKKILEKVFLKRKLKNVFFYGICDFLNDDLWTKKILKTLGRKDIVVFTQNPWTKRCFEKFKIKVLPHPLFLNGISGTEIRERIALSKKWEDLVLPEVVEFLKKIKAKERIKFLKEPEKEIIKWIFEKVKETKTKGAVVGVSGGVDSSLCAFLTKKALGKNALFLWMPILQKKIPKEISLLQKILGFKVKKISLRRVFKNFLEFLPQGNKKVKGNLMARLRMATLYYFSNLKNYLVVGTTNKSELLTGYFTKYGDGGVDIEPLADFYKTEIYEIAKRVGLPKEILEKKPSAGFWPGQTDEKELGWNYFEIDTFLKLKEQGFSLKEISFLTEIPFKKIESFFLRCQKNSHKLFLPPILKKPKIK